MYTNLIQKDLKHIWHPCSYMQDFAKYPPLVVESAKGSYIHTDQGPIIDGISSWWCKALGHSHPEVIAAINQQLHKFEHVMPANTTNATIVELAEELSKITGNQHAFFASDGASAIEIALKLAIQASRLKGMQNKKQFVSLQNAYHGDTFATMSLGDLGKFKKAYSGLIDDATHIKVPYVSGVEDPKWSDSQTQWEVAHQKLQPIKDKIAAIIVEPIVQGAAGMLCYSADFLSKLYNFAKQNNIYLIADEIMTGLGRTGKWLAQEHANFKADFTCLSKGLTSGSIPFSVTTIDNNIYELFHADYSPENSFLHSHTYSGNPLAASAALATLKIMQRINIPEMAQKLGSEMQIRFQQLQTATGKLTNIRTIGGIIAGDLTASSDPRIGHKVAQAAQKHGALLRPIGKSIYWLPPIIIDISTLDKLTEITHQAIQDAYKLPTKTSKKVDEQCFA